jgi:hypothetical protein
MNIHLYHFHSTAIQWRSLTLVRFHSGFAGSFSTEEISPPFLPNREAGQNSSGRTSGQRTFPQLYLENRSFIAHHPPLYTFRAMTFWEKSLITISKIVCLRSVSGKQQNTICGLAHEAYTASAAVG